MATFFVTLTRQDKGLSNGNNTKQPGHGIFPEAKTGWMSKSGDKAIKICSQNERYESSTASGDMQRKQAKLMQFLQCINN